MTFLNPGKRADGVTCKFCDGDAVRCCTACGDFGCDKHVPATEQAPLCRSCQASRRRKTAAILLAGAVFTGLALLVTHWLW